MLTNEGFDRLQILLGCVLFFGVCSNVALFAALMTWKNMNSRTKLQKRLQVYLHLTVIDLLGCIISLVPEIAVISSPTHFEWKIDGDVGCRVVKLLQIAFMYGSSNFVVIIALQKVIAVVRPIYTRVYTSQLENWKAYFVIYVLSFVLALPQVFVFKGVLIQTPDNETIITVCTATFQSGAWTENVHIWYFCTTTYIIPAIILILSYGRIACVLSKSTLKPHAFVRKLGKTSSTTVSDRPTDENIELQRYRSISSKTLSILSQSHGLSNNDTCLNNRHGGIRRRRIQGIPVAISLAIAFILGWLPFFLGLFDMHYNQGQLLRELDWIMLPLGNLNFCLNPWLCFLIMTRCSLRTT